ncbi:Transferase [Parasponia andersonii]|uniref:Transferase n=1 Tax=Parasponia andersonii TaxID=3476 RepID=A0A2P5AFW6_PARAD|nr:Transferase [Parasponia andersonii]
MNVAGRLRSLGNGRFELDCNEKGVVFVAAELNADLVDFGDDFTPTPDFDRFLFPALDDTVPLQELPLCLLQLTKFKCGNFSLSLAMSHVVADGLATANFTMEWARLARCEPLRTVPFLDKKAYRTGAPGAQPLFDHSNDFGCLPFLLKQPSAKELKRMKTIMISLGLGREQVEKPKKIANQDRPINLNATRPFTRYEALTAHIWRCASKARKHQDEQPTGCLVTIDSRRHLDPPLPLGYFGNGVFDVTASSYAGELLSKPLGYGASKIRSAIEMVKNDYVLSAVDYLKCQQDLTKFQYSYKASTNGGANYGGNPKIGVINWMNLPVNGTDFGWGKEIHSGPAYHKVDGDTWIIRSDKGDESLIIVVCLLEDHVEAFKKHFYDDINYSHSTPSQTQRPMSSM